MGTYINPGNRGFDEINTPDYVDKTMLIDYFNRNIGTIDKLLCITCPHGFGKTYTARMLSSYFDRSCDSHSLFDDKKIALNADYEKNMNGYNVIYLDMSDFVLEAREKGRPLADIPFIIEAAVAQDLKDSGFDVVDGEPLGNTLLRIAGNPENGPFVFIIDDWDAPIRAAKNDRDARKSYLSLLRFWFKNGNLTPNVVAAAFMTGILPIMADGSESSVSDFHEYTMEFPGSFAGYIGFTENEVRKLCSRHAVDFEEVRRWYGGYRFRDTGEIFNPSSVMAAVRSGLFRSYVTGTPETETLSSYISLRLDGLAKAAAELAGGMEVRVNTVGFARDLTTFMSRDNVLTLLVHLGYLAYDAGKETARIPNGEMLEEFRKACT